MAQVTINTLTAVKGIGEAMAEELKKAGIKGVKDLLEKGATPKGRKEIAAAVGKDAKDITKWVNQADLYRIKGIGQQYAFLLEASGVDTVPELAQRKAENLYAKMKEVNSEKNFVKQMPSASKVEDWVAQAKELPRILTY